MHTISVVGIGKLGLCMAGCIADAGYRVLGADLDRRVVDAVNRGEAPYVEPGLAELLARTRQNLRATTSTADAVAASEATFVVVATPTLPDGTYSNAQLEASLRAIGEGLRAKRSDHLVIVSCTVMPGTMEGLVIPILEEASGRRLHGGLALAYNPEFIAMGDVIRIFSRPDFVLVGESEASVGERLAELYGRVCSNKPPLARMNLISAELTKIALNCFVTTKITYANMLAELCEHVPGADLGAITAAMGRDARIGPRVLRGGLGFGGPCFPRDNRAFATFAESRGVEARLPRLVQELNEAVQERIAARIEANLEPGAAVAVLGLAYKPNTPLVDESPSLEIVRRLLDHGFSVRAYDPLATPLARQLHGGALDYAGSVEECLAGCQAAVVASDSEETRRIAPELFRAHLPQGGLVFDCWRHFRAEDFAGLRYEAVGLPS